MDKGRFTPAEIVDKYSVSIYHSMDNEIVIAVTRKMAQMAGFKLVDEAMTATLASELTTNIIRYAKTGIVVISIIRDKESPDRKGIEIDAADRGPGIEDISLALKESHTTTMGSLGMGLPSVYNYMDEFRIESSKGNGTHVTVRKWC